MMNQKFRRELRAHKKPRNSSDEPKHWVPMQVFSAMRLGARLL